MGDFFQGLYSGIQMPQVVWNQGPLPSGGRLPRPLHNDPDARINYNSSLLGDITPYAYGEPGYLSSQTAYLNIPHKIQKIVPVVHLPDAKRENQTLFELSHPVDDGDLAFVMRLNKNSFFCTGSTTGSMHRNPLGTAVDPLINLATVNYLLSGFQLGYTNGRDREGNLWNELLSNIDAKNFAKGPGKTLPPRVTLQHLITIMRDCIRPFGIVRGSEKQGGQNESTLGPATWPVAFVVSVTLDGKESNVLNVWHHHNINAGDDLVLRWKLKHVNPVMYTLNHYYKGVKRQGWERQENNYVWQLVPDILSVDGYNSEELNLLRKASRDAGMHADLFHFGVYHDKALRRVNVTDAGWSQLGYWHIGRSQIMSPKYGAEEFWNNDLANQLMTNHLDMTVQPVYQQCPFFASGAGVMVLRGHMMLAEGMSAGPSLAAPVWKPELRLERLGKRARESQAVLEEPVVADDDDSFFPEGEDTTYAVNRDDLAPGPLEPVRVVEPVLLHSECEPVLMHSEAEPVAVESLSMDVGSSQFGEDPVTGRISTGLVLMPEESVPQPPEPMVAETAGEVFDIPVPGLGGPKKQGSVQRGAKRRAIGGSLLKPDGTSEDSMVGML